MTSYLPNEIENKSQWANGISFLYRNKVKDEIRVQDRANVYVTYQWKNSKKMQKINQPLKSTSD